MKGKKFTIEDKNKIVIEYLSGNITKQDIIRKYNITARTMLDNWIKQFKEFGTAIDKRGRVKQEKKEINSYEDMTREQLIKELELRDDIKKAMVYLKLRKTNTK